MRRKTYECRAVYWQVSAAWYAKIAVEQRSAAYQRVAADHAKLAMKFLMEAVNYHD